jgi:hypothetical protein
MPALSRQLFISSVVVLMASAADDTPDGCNALAQLHGALCHDLLPTPLQATLWSQFAQSSSLLDTG